jgi:hypothetical protein
MANKNTFKLSPGKEVLIVKDEKGNTGSHVIADLATIKGRFEKQKENLQKRHAEEVSNVDAKIDAYETLIAEAAKLSK